MSRKGEEAVLIQKIKYLTDLIAASSKQNKESHITNNVQQPQYRPVQSYPHHSKQRYHSSEQAVTFPKSYSASWKDKNQKKLDPRKYVWKKSNRTLVNGATGTAKQNAVPLTSPVGEPSVSGVMRTTKQNTVPLTSPVGEPSVSGVMRTTKQNTVPLISPVGETTVSGVMGTTKQNTVPLAPPVEEKSNCLTSSDKGLQKQTSYPSKIQRQKSTSRTQSVRNTAENNQYVNGNVKPNVEPYNRGSPGKNIDRASTIILDKKIKTGGVDNTVKMLSEENSMTVTTHNSSELDTARLNITSKTESLPSSKLKVVPNFIKKKTLPAKSDISSKSNTESLKLLQPSVKDNKNTLNRTNQGLKTEEYISPDDKTHRQSSLVTKQSDPKSFKRLKPQPFMSKGVNVPEPLTSSSASLSTSADAQNSEENISSSMLSSSDTDNLCETESYTGSVLSEQKPLSASKILHVIRLESSSNRTDEQESVLLKAETLNVSTDPAVTQPTQKKIAVKPSFLTSRLHKKPSGSFIRSQVESVNSGRNEANTPGLQLSSEVKVDNHPSPMCTLRDQVVHKRVDHMQNSDEGKKSPEKEIKEESAKSKLSQQLAQTEAKIQQLRRNIVNRQVTLGSAESIDLRKHKSSPVKSTALQNHMFGPKVKRSESCQVIRKSSYSDIGFKQKVKQGAVVFNPKYSLNRSSKNARISPDRKVDLLSHHSTRKTGIRGICHSDTPKLDGNKKVVFDPKYKLVRSTTVPASHCNIILSGGGVMDSTVTKKTQVMANIIKSKYKLKRTNTSPSHLAVLGTVTSNKNLVKAGNATKVFKSKYKLRKVTTTDAISCSNSSKYRLGRKIGTCLSSGDGNYSNNTIAPTQGPVPPADVPSLQPQSFRFTQQGQLIYTPYGIQKYHTFANKKSSHLKSRRHVHKRAGHKKMLPYPKRTQYTRSPSINQPGHSMKQNRLRRQKRSSARSKFVVLNGMLYKSSAKSLVRTSPLKRTSSHQTSRYPQSRSHNLVKDNVQGKKDEGKSSANHVTIRGVTYMRTGQGSFERLSSSSTRTVASQMVSRSKARVAAKYRKDNTKLKKQYCLFFNRFGKCRRGEKCPYIHDPEKIAVCTRFLRGTCQAKTCLFSHKVDKDKMPVCSYFLRGVCNRDDCPYLHVNVGKKAAVCPDFLRGFCPLGVKCKKMHALDCPAFTKTGHCPDGEKCQLSHNKTKKREKPLKKVESISVPLKRPADIPTKDSDDEIPFKMRKLPVFISIANEQEELESRSTVDTESSVSIRPKF